MDWSVMVVVIVAMICGTVIVTLPIMRAIKKAEKIESMEKQKEQLQEVKKELQSNDRH